MENKTKSKMSNHQADIIVVGAGLVGLSAAIAFAQQGKSMVVIDTSNATHKRLNTWDTRIYALTPATEDWLQSLGVLQQLDTARINNIHAMHIWNQAIDSPVILADEDAHLSTLGIIVENQNLMHALRAGLDALGVTVITDAVDKIIDDNNKDIKINLVNGTQVSATLLVAADGAHSFVRQQLNIATKIKPFNQTALVMNFKAEKNHANVARQWFAPHNILALLPLPAQHVSMVWSVSTNYATELLSLTSEGLAQRVSEQSRHLLGALKPISEVASFALSQATATQLIAPRAVLLGDAAHQIHPMAGQGVNLGFRDVIAFEAILKKAHGLQDIGAYHFLRQYERARKSDIASMNNLTSGLDYLFASEHGALNTATNWGMRQLNKRSSVKSFLIKQAVT